MRAVMVAIISGLFAGGCSVLGIRTEATPAYTVERTVGRENSVEIRRYGQRLAAETVVSGTEQNARSKGFRVLAGYIFGGNSTNTSIDMTAPVAQASSNGQSIDMTAPVSQSRTGDDQWRIRFFMPDTFTLETLPRPNDAAVKLVTVPAETVAVLRYSGSISEAAVHAKESRLMQIVTGAGLQTSGAAFSWFYDPPWTLPPLRRNEAAVLVKASD